MVPTPAALVDPRRIVAEAWGGAWLASALTIALERGLDATFDPTSDPIGDVLASVGLIEFGPDGWRFTEAVRREWGGYASEIAEALRSALGQSASASLWGPGHCDDLLDQEVVLARGRAMDTLGHRVVRAASALGVSPLFEDGGGFLDVATGSGAVAAAVARAFPHARLVAVDPWALALALASRELAGEGLDERVELRHQGIDELEDDQVFDLAWLPVGHVGRETLAEGVFRLHRALRPGGWLLGYGFSGPGPEEALSRWQTYLAGGTVLLADEFDEVARAVGLAPASPVGSGSRARPLLGWRRPT